MSAETNRQLISDTADDAQEIQIDLLALFYRLLDKAWIIILAAVLAAVVGGVYTRFFIDPTYKATVQLYAVGSDDSVIDITQLNISDKMADGYVEVFSNRDVYTAVKMNYATVYKTELPYTFEEVKKMMTVSQVGNTPILQVAFICEDVEVAKRIVEQYSAAAQTFIAQVMRTDEPTIFERPYASTKPVAPSLLRNVVLCFLLGAMAAVGVITLNFIMDDRIRTEEQLRKSLGLATLGMVPIQETEKKHNRRTKEVRS